jgi:hypothetical protein
MTLLIAFLIALLFPGYAEASSSATAFHTDDPSVIRVEVKIRLKPTHSFDRYVYAMACRKIPTMVTACIEEDVPKKRLHFTPRKGRHNVTLHAQSWIYSFVGVTATGTPWDGYARAAVMASDEAWWWLGRGRAHAVPVRPVAHDTLVQGGTP